MTDDLYPRQVNPVLFYEAYQLHQAAGSTYRLANKPPLLASKLTPEQQQRRVILTIAAKLMILERDKLLDQFCAEWLKFRDIPIPEKDNGPSSPVGVQSPEGTDGRLRESGGLDEGGQAPIHNPGSQASPQHGGVPLP